MNGDFPSVVSALFSKAGVFFLWATFFGGAILRWLANARVKGQIRFLNSYDRALLSLKDTPSLSQSELREKSESHFRTYYPAKGGGRLLRSLDRVLGGEATSWSIIDRVVSLAFDPRSGSFNERARYTLASIESLTHFFRFFSLGAFHRIGAATPALLLILGALGTYAGFLHALPFLSPSDISDVRALTTALQDTLARMSSYAGYSILGSLLAFASVLTNAIWDAERSFQSAVHRLAHIVEFLGGLERSNAGLGLAENAGQARPRETGQGGLPPRRKAALKSVPSPKVADEEVAEVSAPAPNDLESAVPETAEKTPVTRRPRSEVVKAEADWGPLPLSAVPSPKKKPIRVEAADVPKPETERSDDDIVAEEISPEIAHQPVRHSGSSPAAVTETPPPAPAPVPVPEVVAAPMAPAPVAAPQTAATSPAKEETAAFSFPETALPSDWEEQIRGLKTQAQSPAARPTEAPAPAPEVPPAPPLPLEAPYDEGLEKTIVGVPQLVETRTETPAAPLQPDFSAVTPPAPAPEPHDSPTEAELLAMMVPKEWATQRPADAMAKTIPDDFEIPAAPVTPAPAPRPVVAPAAAAPVAPAPAPAPVPAKPALTAAEADRLAILEHRMSKVSLYLSKAAEDLKEGIISQEMYDDETSRWHQEVETLNKELLALSAKKAA